MSLDVTVQSCEKKRQSEPSLEKPFFGCCREFNFSELRSNACSRQQPTRTLLCSTGTTEHNHHVKGLRDMKMSPWPPSQESTVQLIAVIALFLLSSDNALSYLDPVSTTFLLQAIAGLLAAAVAGVRSFRRRVLGFFKTGKFVDPEEGSISKHEDTAISTDSVMKNQPVDIK